MERPRQGKNQIFSANQKLAVVIQYLSREGRNESVQAICGQHGISREDIRNWFKILQDRAAIVFEHGSRVRDRNRLQKENDRLRKEKAALELERDPDDYDGEE